MVKVRVPGTSANMGPGFDCLGIALDIYNQYCFEEIESGLEIYGCEEEFKGVDNLIYIAMKKCFEKVGYGYRGIRIKVESGIPVSRGLGSSATCILAGLLGANELAGGNLSKDEILELAVEIEGHPDNIVPALYGGMVVSVMGEGEVYRSSINISKGIKFMALIPNIRLSTKESRSVIPKKIYHSDCVFNVGRTALMVASLVNGDFHLLKKACQDRIHENYRGNLIPDFQDIIRFCENEDTLGVYLSGAGPTIMVILKEENSYFYEKIRRYLSHKDEDWRCLELKCDKDGASIIISEEKGAVC